MANNLDFLLFKADKVDLSGNTLKISGKKLPPPSKRITLVKKGLRVVSAQITKIDKKGDRTIAVLRINHLPTKNQVRLHTEEILYPGSYELIIELKT